MDGAMSLAALALIPIGIAFIDWGLPMDTRFVQERIEVCTDRGLDAELLYTKDYWKIPDIIPVKNYVRSIRCLEPRQEVPDWLKNLIKAELQKLVEKLLDRLGGDEFDGMELDKVTKERLERLALELLDRIGTEEPETFAMELLNPTATVKT